MAISDKLNYLIETKSQLKDMINYGLDENKITNSTTFREYVSSVKEAFLEALRNPDTLFTNLPKKSGTGANITLNDTANAPMRIMLNATELTQDGTPTPSSPQDIHTISGSNKVVVKGKNISNFGTNSGNGITFNTNNIIIKNPTSYNYADNWNLKYDTSLSGGTYTIYAIANGTTDGTRAISINIGKTGNSYAWQMSFPTTQTTYNNYAKVGAITLNENEVITYMNVFVNGSMTTDLNIKVMVVKGSYTEQTIGNYEPYTSQEAEVDLGNIEYCKIGNYEDKFIRTSGKNLLPTTLDKWEQGSLNESGNVSSTTRIRTIDYYPIQNDTNYYISVQNTNYCYLNIYLYNSSKQYIGQYFTYDNSINGATSKQINIPSTYVQNVAYMRVIIRRSDNTSTITASEITSILPMMNLGTTPTDYEPYGSNEWYIKKNIGKVVLSASWAWGTAGSTNYQATLTNTNKLYLARSGQGLSTHFPVKTSGSDIFLYPILQSGIDYIRISNATSQWTTLDDFKTFITNNNVIYEYPLATPTYTQITGTLETQLENVYQKLLSYTGQTNISQINNDLPFIMNVSAIEV